jgi:hypothetical protein
MVVGCGVMSLIASRDVWFSGSVISYAPARTTFTSGEVPSCTTSEGSVEAPAEHGIDAPFYIGDKFSSQLCGLLIICLAMYKFASCFLVQYGSDGSRLISKHACSGKHPVLVEHSSYLFFGCLLQQPSRRVWICVGISMTVAYEAFILSNT